MTTLVLCVDRAGDIAAATGTTPPVVGRAAVRELVTGVGLADPEDSGVNCLLEALRVADDLDGEVGDGDPGAVVAVVAGGGESVISADRAVARQVDDLVAEYDPESAVVVVDSAEDERLVPIIESRVRVDSVDRVVVRQARDIESTYYLLKQFLADEELRQTVLVPIGVALVVFPALSAATSAAVAVAVITTVIGLFLLYKGLGVDDYLLDVATAARDAVYSGQVSIVTYAVAAGLTLIGAFAGAFGVPDPSAETGGVLLISMAFAYDAVPWLTAAAATAALGRLIDEAIEGRLPTAYLNLPFVAVAIGLVVRGLAAYFLELGDALAPARVPSVRLGVLSVAGFDLAPGERLLVFFVGAVVVGVVGIRVAAALSGATLGGADPEADEDVVESGP